MNLLRRTFALIDPPDPGVYLTPSLYVSHEIWHRRDIKIKGEEEKIRAAELLIVALESVREVEDCETIKVFQSLLKFQDSMEESQLILSKKLGVEAVTSPVILPHARKGGKTIRQFLGPRKQGDVKATTCLGYHGHYQSTLHHLFSLSQQLTTLYNSLEHDDLTIKEQVQLDQIFVHAAFFFGRVMVKLYLQDLGVLIGSKLGGVT